MAGTGRKRMLGAFLVGVVLGVVGLGPPAPARGDTRSGCDRRAASDACSQPAPCRDSRAQSYPCYESGYDDDCYDRCDDCYRGDDEASDDDEDADDGDKKGDKDDRKSDVDKKKDDKQDDKQKDDKKEKERSRLGKLIRDLFD